VDEVMASFSLAACRVNEGLAAVLARHAGGRQLQPAAGAARSEAREREQRAS